VSVRNADPRLDAPPGPLAGLLTRLARLLFPLRGGRPARGEIRRVLVVRTDDRVGNALLTVPLALALRDLLPGARVDLLLARRRAAVADGLPGIRVVRFEKTDAFRHPLRFIRFLRELRGAGYDAVIDAAHWHAFSLTSALISRLGARRWLVGADRGPAEIYSRAVPIPPPGLPEIEAKLLLLEGLDLAPPAAPSLQTALDSPDWAEEALRGVGRFALLVPGARKPDHRWPGDRFASLARELNARRGLRSLIAWGPGEEALARSVAEAGGAGAQLAPPSDLAQLAALLRRSSLAVTNDTGPMHLAAACGAPVLALLHAADGERWIHVGPRFRALVAPEVSQALAAAEALLDSAGAAVEPAY
jgi:ADP-heptose:LPS heptosyltransferase